MGAAPSREESRAAAHPGAIAGALPPKRTAVAGSVAVGSTAGLAGGLGMLLQTAMLALGFAGSISSIDPGRSPAHRVAPVRLPANPVLDIIANKQSVAVVASSTAAPGLAGYLARQTGLSCESWDSGSGKPSWLWGALIRNTHLDANAIRERREAPIGAAIVIDPSGSLDLPCAREVWRFENPAGAPIFTPFLQSVGWQRPPFTAEIRLVRYERGALEGAVLATACVGTRVPFRALANTLAEVAAIQLREALGQRASFAPDQVSRPASPCGGSALRLTSGWARHQARRWKSRLYSEFWCVGVVRQPLSQILANGAIGEITWFDDGSRAAYLADPFILPETDAVLCEEYPYETGIGRIVRLDPKTGTRQAVDLCGAATHRSYPYTWSEAGTVYILPESSEDRQSTLYKLEPDGSASVAAVIGHGIRMADPTLFRAEGYYWIAFADLDIAGGANLSLLYAESLLGPWRAHPRNPVKMDIRSSRPAGTPFRHEGALYRPAQDCSRTYGWGVAINRVREISPTRYVEVTERWFHPARGSRFSDGMHTLAAAGDFTLIDGKRLTIRSTVLLQKLARRLGYPGPGAIFDDTISVKSGYGAAALRVDALPDGTARPSAGVPT